MTDYRRGLVKGAWQEHWHFKPDCLQYPERNYAVQQLEPLKENLCSRCSALGKGAAH